MAQGSRLLNENGNVLGLGTQDLIGAMVVLVVASAILEPFAIDVLALPIALSALAALLPVRLRYRRKIVRDTASFYLTSKRLCVSKKRS